MATTLQSFLSNALSGVAPSVQAHVTALPGLSGMPLSGGGASLTNLGTNTLGLDLNAFKALNFQDLNSVASFAATLPTRYAQPDATGEVPTGASTIGREEAATAAILAATPRVVHALGADAATVDLRGHSYDVIQRYEDPVSGFSALRLHPEGGGAEVFAIDGLQVGSHADDVASATLGRLQVDSAAFRALVIDADTYAIQTGGPVLVTGASLGGGMAEVAAYEISEGLVASRKPFATGAVHLVTVDALGGRDATESINGGHLDPAALKLIDALGVRDDGDIVSRIGSHIGDTVTFPTYDATGHRVQLGAEAAHVDVISLMQVLSSDALFAQGVRGQPAEISGFAAASNALSDSVIRAYLASGAHDPATQTKLQVPGIASFDATRTAYSLDANSDGAIDLVVHLSHPAPPSIDPFVL